MAIREIREIGDDILNKPCKKVTKMTMRTQIVIDVGEGPIVLINPEIIETSGEQTGEEGCLSVPGKWGIVTRPNVVKVRALNEEMEEFELEGEGLLARAFCHEIDHLLGNLYVDKVEDGLHDVTYEEQEDEE